MRNQQRRNGREESGNQNRDLHGQFQGRRDDERNSQDDNGRYDSPNYYRDRESNYGGSRGNNSGYEQQRGPSNFDSAGRRGENYGQDHSDSYRNFGTQGRNSGSANQGGYSSPVDTNNDWNDKREWSDYSRENETLSNNSGNDRNGGFSYRPYNQNEYQPMRRSQNERSAGDNNRPAFETSAADSSNRSDRSSFGQEAQSHRGKGPKGYQRSDQRVQEDVSDHLTDDHMIDASEIDVKVAKGEVTLTGTVASKQEKRRAEDIAESVSGVTNVDNRLRVEKVSEGSDKNESKSKMAEKKSPANGVHA